MAFNALRFPLAAAVLLAILASREGIRWPERSDLPRIIVLGILGNVGYQMLFIFGLEKTLAGNAALLLAGTPVWTTILSSLAGHERIPMLAWAGLAGTIAGMGLVVLGGGDGVSLGTGTLVGDLMIAGASVTWSIYTVAGRNLIHQYGSLPMTAWTLWVGSAILVLMGLPSLAASEPTTFSARAWLGVVYAGTLAIGVAYLLWNRGVRALGNARTAVHSNLVPVVALVAAWGILGERPSLVQVLGAGIIIGGVTLTRAPGRTPAGADA